MASTVATIASDCKAIEQIGVVILGSTGSIGCSTLDVIRSHPQIFKVIGLVAGTNITKLRQQADEFTPRFAVLTGGDVATHNLLVQKPRENSGSSILPAKSEGTYWSTDEELMSEQLAAPDVDVVVGAIVGLAGLKGVWAAVNAGKRIVLANKESLVCAGSFITARARETGSVIIPADSEHSAIFQLLQGSQPEEIDRLILTASGGPFRNLPLQKLSQVTAEMALKHPTWSMGKKISIDSATMVNKAFELIEAHWIFQIEESRIDVVVHPQSLVHSFVQFVDGTLLAHLSVADMKGPLAYALSYPGGRLSSVMEPLNLLRIGTLTFEELDEDRFSAVRLARFCLSRDQHHPGGASAASFNIANDIAVAQFLEGERPFLSILDSCYEAVDRFGKTNVALPEDLAELAVQIAGWLKSS